MAQTDFRTYLIWAHQSCFPIDI